MKTTIIFLIFMFFLSINASLLAQETLIFQSVNEEIHQAKELYRENQFVSALHLFIAVEEKLAKDSEVRTEALFYHAMCAVRLKNKDADNLLLSFISNHPESQFVNHALFELANYLFDQRKYSNVLRTLDQLDVSVLGKKDKAKYRYIKGYSSFELDRLVEAEKDFAQIKDGTSYYSDPATYYWAHIQYLNENYEAALKEFNKLKENDSFAEVVPYYISQIYYKQEKYSEAVAYSVPLLEQADKYQRRELHKIIGDSYFHLNEFNKAIPFLEQYFAESNNRSREENYMLGYCYYLDGKEAEAISFLETASGGKDELAQNAYYHLADCYVSVNDKNKARQAFQAASEFNFDEKIKEDALFNYAKITYELSYSPFNETIKAFDKYISLYPNSERNKMAYDYLVKVYMTTANYSEAIASIEKIEVKNQSIFKAYQRVTFYRGLECFNNLDYQLAINYLDKSLQTDATNREYQSRAIFWKAEANYRLNNYDEAVSGYLMFIKTKGASSFPEYNTAYYNLGYAYFKLEDYNESAKWFLKYVSLQKESRSEKIADAYNRLGDCYYLDRNYVWAIANYEKAYQIGLFDPDYALFQKAFCFGFQQAYTQKINNLITLLQSYPKSSLVDDALYQLGRTCERTNQFQLAVGYYNDILQEYPQSSYVSKALIQLGLIYYNKNDYRTSIEYYKQVVERFPGSQEANAALQAMKNDYVELNDVETYFSYAAQMNPSGKISASEQDSLTYYAAEKLYMAGDSKSGSALEKYLKQYPEGSFVLNAHFYLGEFRYNEGEYGTSLKNYEYVAGRPDNIFTEQSLSRVAELILSSGDYQNALPYFERLEKISNTKWNILKARAGKMRCYFKLKNYPLCIESAKALLGSEKVSDVLKREANYKLSISLYETENEAQALPLFVELAKDTKSKEGAEAKFMVAQILFDQQKISDAENEIVDFISKNTPYQYWLAKSFILLADIYLKQDDTFQARHTLKSMIENYPVQDDGILDSARQKLRLIDDAQEKTNDVNEKAIEINLNQKGKQ